MSKKCRVCGIPIYGRIDKKYCSDSCRNQYHNGMSSSEAMYMRRINYLIRKNRKILMDLIDEDISASSFSFLRTLGFNFQYLTHYVKNKDGTITYYCYELGYTPSNGDQLALTRDVIRKK